MINKILKSLNGYSISILVHVILIIVIVFFILIKSCFKKEDYHIFEITNIEDDLVLEKEIKKVKTTTKPIKEVKDYKKIDYNAFKEISKPKIYKKKNIEELPNFEIGKKPSEASSSKNESLTLNEYREYVWRKLEKTWSPQDDFVGYRTTVEFVILKNGLVDNLKIISSSGNSIFDESVIKVLAKIGRFKPNPSGKDEKFRWTCRMK